MQNNEFKIVFEKNKLDAFRSIADSLVFLVNDDRIRALRPEELRELLAQHIPDMVSNVLSANNLKLVAGHEIQFNQIGYIDESQPYFTVRQFSEMLNVSEKYVESLIQERHVAHVTGSRGEILIDKHSGLAFQARDLVKRKSALQALVDLAEGNGEYGGLANFRQSTSKI